MAKVATPAASNSIKLRYEFLGLEDEIRDEAIALTIEGRNFERNSLEAIVGFGRVALRMQELLAHGEFTKWLDAEFKLSTAMAYNFINVAKKFGDQIPIIQELPITMTVLYQIAEPSAPAELTDKVLSKANEGVKMSVKEVKELKQELKQSQQQNEEQEQEVMELLDERNRLIDQMHDLQRQINVQKGIIESQHNNVPAPKPAPKKSAPVNEFEEDDDDEEEDLETDDADDFFEEEEKDPEPVVSVAAKRQEVEDLEKKLKELRSADKELNKRIAEKEAKSANFSQMDPELREKKIRLEQFKLKVIRLLSESAEEELMLNASGMDSELVQWYEVIGTRCQKIADTCQQMVSDYKKAHT